MSHTRFWFTAVLLALAPLASAQPETGESTTFCKTLSPGVNLVSLPVVPADPALPSVLADILPKVVLVQDEEGRHFVPSQDVHDLTEWEWDET